MGADILGGGAPAAAPPSTNALLGDIFGIGNVASTTFYIPPKQEWLNAAKGKGLEVRGTFSRKNGTIYMDMTFSNKAMQPLSGFGIQFNKNSFGLAPAQPLNVPSIPPNQSVDVSLPMNTGGAVQKNGALDQFASCGQKQYRCFLLCHHCSNSRLFHRGRRHGEKGLFGNLERYSGSERNSIYD